MNTLKANIRCNAWMQNLRAVLIITAMALALPAFAGGASATLYKNPDCGCCNDYADYLRAHGFTVQVIPTQDLPQIKRQNGVPDDLASCHTMRIGNYVFEGHVPVESIRRVLAEKPRIKGLSVPDMPAGSPGMSGKKTEPLNVYVISDRGVPQIYATY